ncbi:unnamed protein product [Lactuca saligna]|uniref:Uncharacterized protein n=1 Tax=Lactuca saligna TaxID=75948 RepID=A0AA36EBN4_LACSI|nr:unnamed protein product [Lactuca saligna]
MVPRKTVTDVMRLYKELEDDNGEKNNSANVFLSPPPYGAQGNRSSIIVVVSIGPKELRKRRVEKYFSKFRGIRTPTQVRIHAHKYFIQQLSEGKDKRISSIHDITIVNLNENHITSPKYKTTASPEQCKVPWNQPNNENTAMAFNQTHGAISCLQDMVGTHFVLLVAVVVVMVVVGVVVVVYMNLCVHLRTWFSRCNLRCTTLMDEPNLKSFFPFFLH